MSTKGRRRSGEILTPREAGMLYGPDGEQVSAAQEKRKARKRERRTCRYCGEKPAARKMPGNGVPTCGGCCRKRLE